MTSARQASNQTTRWEQCETLTVVGRPAFAVPPSRAAPTALGQPSKGSSSGAGAKRFQSTASRAWMGPTPARVLPSVALVPGNSLITHAPDEVLQSICHCLGRPDWHVLAVTSRGVFNSLALYEPLPSQLLPEEEVIQLPEVSDEPVLRDGEPLLLGILAGIVWIIIFFGGRAEWGHGIERACGPMCDVCGKGDLSFRTIGCRRCHDGYLNGGMKCYERLEDLPSLKTGASLGGHFYYHAIIAVQAMGALSEIVLLIRLRMRRMIIGKEVCVALTALVVEILRMVLVDIFLLRTYFFNHEYKIFGLAADGSFHGYLNATAQNYVIAWSHLGAGELNVDECTIFGKDSPLLDYDESFGWGTGGHPRFRTVGWVIGGEFAMYYFFAAVVNEVADNLFIIPATTLKYGFKCKILSMILEMFQLGALFPAAAFSHGKCLTYHNPMNANLGVIRYTIVTWGYFLWGSVFVIGAAAFAVGSLHLVVFQPGFAQIKELVSSRCLWLPSFAGNGADGAGSRFCCLCRRSAGACRKYLRGPATACLKFIERLGASAMEAYLFIASIPLLITGTALGVLVCLGQASKKGAAEVLTAIVLLSDVLLKLALFLLVETTDELLRREGERRRAERAKRLAEARRQLELGNGELAFPTWWQRKSQAVTGPTKGWRRRIWQFLHA